MFDLLTQLLSEYRHAVWWVAAASAGLLLFSLVSLPLVAVMLPADFIPRKLHRIAGPPPARSFIARHPAIRWTLRVLKNFAGGVLAVAGLAMLVLPGQGLLTLALAVLLLDLPGKQKLEARILRSPRLFRLINRLRQRCGRPPLQNADSPLPRPTARVTA